MNAQITLTYAKRNNQAWILHIYSFRHFKIGPEFSQREPDAQIKEMKNKMKRHYKYLIASVIAPFAFTGVAAATLIGDSVTVGHYTGVGTGMGALTGSLQNFTVTGGINDLTEFQGPPQGQVFSGKYLVDVGANKLSVDFSSVSSFRTTYGPIEVDPYTGEPLGSSGTYSFNGFRVGGINDSSGAPLQSVLVDTDILGWGSSRVNFTADSVAFDWKGLGATTANYFNAELVFAPPAVPPAPYTGPTLIGDSVTVGHYIDIGSGMGPLTSYLQPITVAYGINDLVEFQGPPQGQVFSGNYKVDVRANNLSVDFSSASSFRPTYGAIEYDPNTGEPIGGSGTYSFNGLMVGNMNASTGAAIQSVSVNTDMAGWDASRLGLTGDSVSFDWRGLGGATYFDATFNYASDSGPGPGPGPGPGTGTGGGGGTSVPEPSTLLLIGSGIAGYALTRQKKPRKS